MRLGSILVCDAVRPRGDGLFDAIGAGQQLVFVDADDREFKRTVVVQLECEPRDAGVARQVDLALVAPNDEVLVGAALEVTNLDQRLEYPEGALHLHQLAVGLHGFGMTSPTPGALP